MTRKAWVILGAFTLLAIGGGAVIETAGRLTVKQLLTLARNAGFSGDDLSTAVAIALAESGGYPSVVGDAGVPHAGDASYGLWQINSFWHPEYGPDFAVLYDPQRNANAAFSIYRAAGGFSPWSTFKTGAYTSYLPEITAEV